MTACWTKWRHWTVNWCIYCMIWCDTGLIFLHKHEQTFFQSYSSGLLALVCFRCFPAPTHLIEMINSLSSSAGAWKWPIHFMQALLSSDYSGITLAVIRRSTVLSIKRMDVVGIFFLNSVVAGSYCCWEVVQMRHACTIHHFTGFI